MANFGNTVSSSGSNVEGSGNRFIAGHSIEHFGNICYIDEISYGTYSPQYRGSRGSEVQKYFRDDVTGAVAWTIGIEDPQNHGSIVGSMRKT
jgi:hypothetical protein